MNLLIICCLVVAVTAGPLIQPSHVKILKYDNYNDGTGSFKYEVEQSDGSKSQARGNLVKVVAEGKEVDVLVIEGSYSYVIDGRTYTVRYVADQNGYHPNIVVQEPSRPTPSTPFPPPRTTRPPPPSTTRQPPPPTPSLLSNDELILKSLLGGSSGTVRYSKKRTREVALDNFFLIMNYIHEDMKKYQ